MDLRAHLEGALSEKKEVSMEKDYILKTDILKLITLKKNKWMEIKGQDQDVVKENFIDNVIWAFDSIIIDIEKI